MVEKWKIGRIRMEQIPHTSSKYLVSFISEAIEPGNKVITDGWIGYSGLIGYRHKVINISRRNKSASGLLPGVHRVALKRWFMGTHQGAVCHDHFGYYLDEFTFRFNRGTSSLRGKLFYRLLESAVQGLPAPYASIFKHV